MRIRKPYYNKMKLPLWERLYIFEVLRGLGVTTKVFIQNMFKWLTFRKGALTAYYPEEVREDLSTNNRGKHYLVQRKDGSPRCVACYMCSTVCPAGCIKIEAGEYEDDDLNQKYPTRYEIDLSLCVFCGFCEDACPEDAVRLSTEFRNLCEYDRNDMLLKMDHLLTWNPKSDSKKDVLLEKIDK
jgi:NADH-quinone oxidoreductase subunit I